MNYADASSLLLSIRGIQNRTDRLRAVIMMFPPDALQSACKLSEPSVEATDRAIVYRFSENGFSSYECLPDVQYCSCQYFEKNVIFNASSATVWNDDREILFKDFLVSTLVVLGFVSRKLIRHMHEL